MIIQALPANWWALGGKVSGCVKINAPFSQVWHTEPQNVDLDNFTYCVYKQRCACKCVCIFVCLCSCADCWVQDCPPGITLSYSSAYQSTHFHIPQDNGSVWGNLFWSQLDKRKWFLNCHTNKLPFCRCKYQFPFNEPPILSVCLCKKIEVLQNHIWHSFSVPSANTLQLITTELLKFIKRWKRCEVYKLAQRLQATSLIYETPNGWSKLSWDLRKSFNYPNSLLIVI